MDTSKSCKKSLKYKAFEFLNFIFSQKKVMGFIKAAKSIAKKLTTVVKKVTKTKQKSNK